MIGVRLIRGIAAAAGLGALTLGLLFWIAQMNFISIHMLFGLTVALSLLILGIVGVFTSGMRLLGAIGIVYAPIVPAFGLTQATLLLGNLHWLIQTAHLLVACDLGGSAPSTVENPVHMNDTNFVQASITIKKGERLMLIDDAFTPHIVANGTWENGTAHSAREPGAPLVKDVQINGTSSQAIGPFATAGTFKLYCILHAGMNLTVVVQ